jgi:hypothetical protein
MNRMISNMVSSQIQKNRDLILNEARHIEGFMRLLMKQRNTGEKWSLRERLQLKEHIRRLVGYIPILCIFLLPGSFLLIPLLAEIVDRRRQSREAKKHAQRS